MNPRAKTVPAKATGDGPERPGSVGSGLNVLAVDGLSGDHDDGEHDQVGEGHAG